MQCYICMKIRQLFSDSACHFLSDRNVIYMVYNVCVSVIVVVIIQEFLQLPFLNVIDLNYLFLSLEHLLV